MTDCAQHTADRMVLFPGGSPWRGNWRSDIIRNNKTIAYVEFTSYAELGQTELHGWLDRKNINDRPSASISTTGANNHWNLDGFDAFELELGKSDGKVYTIALDDQSGVTWEAKFRHENIKGLTTAVNKVIRFRTLKPRGYNADAVAPPDMGNIRKFELSFPSMDGKQEGPFMISIASISVVRLPCECPATLDPKLDEPLKGLEYAWEKVKYRTSALAFKLHLKRPKPRLRKRRRSFWPRPGRRP